MPRYKLNIYTVASFSRQREKQHVLQQTSDHSRFCYLFLNQVQLNLFNTGTKGTKLSIRIMEMFLLQR